MVWYGILEFNVPLDTVWILTICIVRFLSKLIPVDPVLLIFV